MKQVFNIINKSQLTKITFLLLLLLTVSVIAAYAQPPEGFGPDPDSPDTPVDGGISILLAAGIGIGIKKYKELRKKKNDDSATKK
jgi:hypothetical protein